jgi:hypothetical protein
MVVSSRSPQHRRLLAALAFALAAVVLLAPSASAAAAPSAPAAPPAFTTRDAPVLLARAGSGTHGFSRGRTSYGSRGYGSRGYGSRGYGYGYGSRRTGGRSFVHGLFVGWTLGHFFGFGGGIPLFPLLFVMFVLYLMLRGGGRRRPPRRGRWLQY